MLEHLGGEASGFLVGLSLTSGPPTIGLCQSKVLLGRPVIKQAGHKQQQRKYLPAQLLGVETKLKIKDSLTKSYTPSSWALHIMRCGQTE